jgi:hypothetical protein
MDKSFLVLVTPEGRVFAYRPGEPAAYEVPIPSGGAVRLVVEPSSRVEGASYALAVAEWESEGQKTYRVLSIGFGGAREVGGDSPEPLRSLSRLILDALGKYPGLRGRAILIPSEGGLGSLVLFSGNIVEVYGGSRIALAFAVLGAAGSGGRVVAVGKGGGVAMIDVGSGDVRYVSIPSSERVFFIDAETAAVTSPRGLFLYSFPTGSVEYIPMPSRPTSLLPSEGLVADEGGRIFRLIRPAPWKGGLSLVATIDSGYVAEMARLGGQVMLLVAGTKPEKTRLMLLGQSGLRTLPEASKLQDAELVRAASLGEAAVLAGPGGIFYVSREGQPIRLGGSEAGATAASWHPDGCVCLVTGRGGRLFGILDGQLLPIPAETSRDLLSAAWGEGYALVGGSGVLYLFDGHRLLELEAPHVTSWQSLAYRGSGEFLASTPLGLILVKASYAHSKPLDSVVLDQSPTARGEQRATIVAIAHERVGIRNVRPEGPAALTDWSGPRTLAPGCPATITVTLKPMGDRSMGSTVWLYIDTDEGSSIEIATLELSAQSQLQQTAAEPLVMPVLLVGAVAAIAVVVVRRVRRRPSHVEEGRSGPGEEPRGEEEGGEERRGSGDLEGDYWGSGGAWD